MKGRIVVTQEQLDEALRQIHRYFIEGDDSASNLSSPEMKERIAILARRGLLSCKATRMVSGNLMIRWTATERITPMGMAHLESL